MLGGVVWSDGYSASAFFLEWTAALFSAELWSRRLPHRGSLSFGRCFVNEASSIFLGRPIVRAAEWEKIQDWMGISIEPKSLKQLSLDQSSGPWFRDYVVPTKSGPVPSRCARVFAPDLYLPVTAEKITEGFLAAYDEAQDTAPVSALARYVETARFFIKCGRDTPELRRVAGLETER